MPEKERRKEEETRDAKRVAAKLRRRKQRAKDKRGGRATVTRGVTEKEEVNLHKDPRHVTRTRQGPVGAMTEAAAFSGSTRLLTLGTMLCILLICTSRRRHGSLGRAHMQSSHMLRPRLSLRLTFVSCGGPRASYDAFRLK